MTIRNERLSIGEAVTPSLSGAKSRTNPSDCNETASAKVTARRESQRTSRDTYAKGLRARTRASGLSVLHRPAIWGGLELPIFGDFENYQTSLFASRVLDSVLKDSTAHGVLFAGCGTGRELHLVGARWPDIRLSGVDIARQSLEMFALQNRVLATWPVHLGPMAPFERRSQLWMSLHS